MNNYSFLCELTQHIINQRHYHNYSQIQRNVIHFLQTSKDNKAIIIKADFGSGKTFAYLIAMLNNISSTIDKLQSVILLPTRELALQTEEYIKPLSDKGLRYLLLIGGNANVPGKKKKDKIDLSLVPHVIIGTLGKVVSVLMKKGKLRYDDNMFYSHLANLVIDEADKMKNQNDKGTFIKFISLLSAKIFSQKTFRFILTSASFSNDDIQFYHNILYYDNKPNYELILDANEENELQQPQSKNVKEYYYIIHNEKHITYYEQKYKIIFSLLSRFQSQYKQCLIFYNQKSKGEELSSDLRSYDMSAVFIHGDLSQDQRQLIYQQIKKLNVKIIITTDLLSRGIDLTAVNLVINFDMPYTDVDYYHRVGRTGRFFSNGIVFSLIQDNEEPKFDKVIKEISKVDDIESEKFIIEVSQYFKDIEKKSRLTKEEKDKIKLLEVDEKKNEKIIEEVKMLNEKRRRDKYNTQAIITQWENVDVKEQQYCSSCTSNNKFCLYCNFFKVFDV